MLQQASSRNTTHHKIKQQENKKIISLIKSKLSPLNTKHKFFPKISQINFLKSVDYNDTSYSAFRQQKQLKICQKHYSYDGDIKKKLKQNTLFNKVKNHIEQKKKVLSIVQIQNTKYKMPRISLSNYIELFSKPQQIKSSLNSKSDFVKLKKQSIALNLFDSIENTMPRQSEKILTQEQICLMNAKLRKQMNHKKLIGIAKAKNK